MSLTTALIHATRPARYAYDDLMFRRFANRDRDRLRSLKDRFAGKPMLVVGNGPSLNQTPLDRFADIPAIGMNKIDLLFERVAWRPSLIICTNNLVVQQHGDVFADSEIPVFLSWKAKRFMPEGKRDKAAYFLSKAGREFSTDIVEGVGSAGTVTYTALQFAYYMGAGPVILFGVDHNFTVNGPANKIEKRQGEDVNHFHPDYFKAGTYWGIPNLEVSEIAFQNSKDAFERAGRKVYDATIGGKLQIFDKIDVEAARRICDEALAQP